VTIFYVIFSQNFSWLKSVGCLVTSKDLKKNSR